MQQIPTPPTDVEKYLYVDQNKFALYVTGTLSFLLLSFGMLLFVYNTSYTWPYLIFFFITSFYLLISYFIGLFGESFNLKTHLTILKTGSLYSPSVDVYLPSCGEDINIILNTLKHVSGLKYGGSLNVYVLDDCKNQAHSKTLEEASKQYKFTYISRPNKGELKKSGNVRHAFAQTSGEFILILDADFAPRPDMLNEMIPYMLNEKIAIVQSPQFFEIKETDPWIQKGASYIQELFYRLIQVNRQTWNGSICVGTCALYRRAALAPHGGTAAIGYSEDVHTGFQATIDGYFVKYIPINLSKGVCPDEPVPFIMQQYRWATGSLSLFTNSKFWYAKLPVMLKLNYLSGMLYYISTAIGLICVPFPALFILLFFPENVHYYNLVFSLPSFIYGTIAVAWWSRLPWGVYAIQVRQLSYWAHFFAIVDKIKNSTIAWVATGDDSLKKSNTPIAKRLYWWFTIWCGSTVTLTLGLSIYRFCFYSNSYNFIPSIIMSLVNLFIFIVTYRSVRLIVK